MAISTHTWKKICIEGSQIYNEESLHREFKFKFGFPGNYGMNFDALFDCLSSLDVQSVSKHWKFGKNEEIVIQISEATSFMEKAATIFSQLLKIIIDVNKHYQGTGNYTRILIELI